VLLGGVKMKVTVAFAPNTHFPFVQTTSPDRLPEGLVAIVLSCNRYWKESARE
jgi:hypothetical protein